MRNGRIGKVTKVKEDNEIEVEIAKDVKIRVVQTTVATVLNKTDGLWREKAPSLSSSVSLKRNRLFGNLLKKLLRYETSVFFSKYEDFEYR